MKNKFIFLILFVFATTAYSQSSIFFKMDGTIGGAFTISEFKAYGISVGIEPKVFITRQLSAGIRLEANALFGGNFSDDGSDVSAGTSSRGAWLLKGEYYFGESGTRGFAGLNMGLYTMANVTGGTSGATISASNSFGVGPELGVTFNNFRISGIYHFVPKKDILTMSSGTTQEISRSYFVVNLGFKIFSVNESQSKNSD